MLSTATRRANAFPADHNASNAITVWRQQIEKKSARYIQGLPRGHPCLCGSLHSALLAKPRLAVALLFHLGARPFLPTGSAALAPIAPKGSLFREKRHRPGLELVSFLGACLGFASGVVTPPACATSFHTTRRASTCLTYQLWLPSVMHLRL